MNFALTPGQCKVGEIVTYANVSPVRAGDTYPVNSSKATAFGDNLHCRERLRYWNLCTHNFARKNYYRNGKIPLMFYANRTKNFNKFIRN